MSPTEQIASAKGRIAYYSRQDVHDAAKLAAARRDFTVAKLARAINDALTDEHPPTPGDLHQFAVLLVKGADR